MPKIFFTERDIEELAARGEMFLEVSDEVVLTELAYEKAQCLGVRLCMVGHAVQGLLKG